MLLKDVLKKYHFSKTASSALMQTGIQTLYPPQAEAIDKGALDGKNLFLSVPTATGKTFIAELCMLRSITQNNGKCLYVVPLKALASEKYQDFKKRYTPLGIQVRVSVGDGENTGQPLNRNDILIVTPEKLDAIMRGNSRWSVKNLSVVIFDEIHFINDGGRGPTLEILATRIKQMAPSAQLLALSATVSNAAEMAQWFNAELVLSTWRPIPLKEGVAFDNKIVFDKDGTRIITEESPEELNTLVMDTLRGKGQTLVFVNSRRSTQAAAKKLLPDVCKALTLEEKAALQQAAKKIVGAESSATKICHALAECMANGVAFHHAGLKPAQRELVENHFKQNHIKVICSTPTLAAGVNLPARRVIMRDIKRFESGLGSAFIPASEYKQCAGRAGRPQYDTYGEAVIMAKTKADGKKLLERYIRATPEPIISKLGTEQALRFHLLASLSANYIHDVASALEFLSHTFFAFQNKHTDLIGLVSRNLTFLETEGFVTKNGYRYEATRLGNLTSRLYLDPYSAIVIRDGLKKISQRKTIPLIGLLQLVTTCPDSTCLAYNTKLIGDIDDFAARHQDQLFLGPEDSPALEDYFSFLSIMKTVMVLNGWCEEGREDALCDQFSIGPGDIYRVTDTTRWLVHACIAIADLMDWRNLTRPLADIQAQVQYGVKTELLNLVHLKNIGRIRGRALFNAGYKRAEDLKHLSVDQLAKVPAIGQNVAKQILKHLNAPVVDLDAVRALRKNM